MAITIDELFGIFRSCAGESEVVVLDESVLDMSFEEIGYDSLALLEVTARLQRDFGVELSEDAVREARTPRALLALVNGALTGA